MFTLITPITADSTQLRATHPVTTEQAEGHEERGWRGPGQDWLHNLQSPVKNENGGPAVQKLFWISRGQKQTMKPRTGPFWAPHPAQLPAQVTSLELAPVLEDTRQAPWVSVTLKDKLKYVSNKSNTQKCSNSSLEMPLRGSRESAEIRSFLPSY